MRVLLMSYPEGVSPPPSLCAPSPSLAASRSFLNHDARDSFAPLPARRHQPLSTSQPTVPVSQLVDSALRQLPRWVIFCCTVIKNVNFRVKQKFVLKCVWIWLYHDKFNYALRKGENTFILHLKISTKLKFPAKMTDFQYRYDTGDNQLACNLFF